MFFSQSFQIQSLWPSQGVFWRFLLGGGMIGCCCLVLYIFGIIKSLHFLPIKWWSNFADIMKKECHCKQENRKLLQTQKLFSILMNTYQVFLKSQMWIWRILSINNYKYQKSLSIAYLANHRDKKFSGSLHPMHGVKTKH